MIASIICFGLVPSGATSIIVRQCQRSYHHHGTKVNADKYSSNISHASKYHMNRTTKSMNGRSDVHARRPLPPVPARELKNSELRSTNATVSSLSSDSYIKGVLAKAEVQNTQSEGFRHKFIKAASVELKRYLQREQHNRVDAFLSSLQKRDSVASGNQQWEVAVAALVHAGGSGVQMTSTLISKVIQLCSENKQYEIASKLFYQFHFDYQLARGRKATLAFLKMCDQTGRYDAASRVVHYIAAHRKSKDAAERAGGDIWHYLDNETLVDSPKKAPNLPENFLPGVSSLSSDIMTYFLRSILNCPSDTLFSRKWEVALNLYSKLRNDPLHVSTIASTPELVDSIVGIAERASHWRAAVDIYSKTLKLLDAGNRVALSPLTRHRDEKLIEEGNRRFPIEVSGRAMSASNNKHHTHSPMTPPISNSISYVYDSTIDAVVRACFRAKRHYEVVRTVQTAVNLGKYVVSAAEVNTANVCSLTATPKSVEKIYYSPDEASARMTIFSVEEVTYQTYDRMLGTNLPEMLNDYEVLYLKDADDVWKKETASSNGNIPGEYDCQRLCITKDDLENRKSSWALASTLFNGLAVSGLPLFPQTYESPLRSFVIAGKWELASKMLLEMKQDGREIPQHYMQLVLCEKVAHMYDTKKGQKLLSNSSLFSPKNPAPYIALMRQAMAVGSPQAFIRASKASRENEAPETNQKLLLTAAFEGSPPRRNLLASIAAFSRLLGLIGRDIKRTNKSSDHKVYDDDSMPLPVLSLMKGYAEEYVSSQRVNKERALSSNPNPSATDVGTTHSPDSKHLPVTLLSSTRCVTYTDGVSYSWEARREENLAKGEDVLNNITKRLHLGLERTSLSLIDDNNSH